jgi:hypothetical protein
LHQVPMTTVHAIEYAHCCNCLREMGCLRESSDDLH